MNYELLINGSAFLSGDLIGLILIAVISLCLLYIAGQLIWRKLTENETLKYEFVTIIAHKFRTPLTSIKWLLEDLLSSETDAHKIENFKDISQSNEKLINLTGTLIEMTNPDKETKASYSFEEVKLFEFVKAVCDTQKEHFHQKNIFFSVQNTGEDVIVSIDKPRMEFVLQTLLENAWTYTPIGRNVDVTVGQIGGKGVIKVADNGIGIEKNDLGKIFTKFFRTKKAQSTDTEGFGVGLYLAKSIVRRHHGKINVFSAGDDQGTTFMIELSAK